MENTMEIPKKKKKKAKNKSTTCCNHSVCLTLCNPMDHRLPGSSVCGDSPGKKTGVSCYALLQGIFPIQVSNLGLPHCRRIFYHLSHQGSPNLPYDPAIPLLGICLEKTTILKDPCTQCSLQHYIQ